MSNKKGFVSSLLFKLILLLFFILICAVIGFQMFISHMKTEYLTHMPASVSVVTAEQVTPTNWQNYVSTTGSLNAIEGATLSAEQSGRITSIDVKSGEYVKAGTTILTLNDAVQQADLLAAKASLIASTATYNSDKKLVKAGAISYNTYAAAEATYQYDVSQVKLLEATIALYNVKAPFSGTLGTMTNTVGQYLTVGTTVVSLQNSAMLKVDFTVPQNDLPKLKLNQKVLLNIPAVQKTFTGYISAINNTVSSTTGLVDVEVLVKNKQHDLLPGMFANVRVLLPLETNQIVIPNVAVTYTLYGNTVYVLTPVTPQIIKQDHLQVTKGEKLYVATMKAVDVLNHRGIVTQLAPQSLSFNSLIVTSGQQRLVNGSIVKILHQPAIGTTVPKVQSRL